MNRCEKVMLDRMADMRYTMTHANADYLDEILLLLDCVVEWRYPPESLAVEDGCGAMVDKGAK